MKRFLWLLTALLLCAGGMAEENPLTLRTDYTLAQGRATLYWLDSGYGAPYTLYYTLMDETPDRQAEYCRMGILERSCTLDHLVPGGAYWIVLTDQAGHSDEMVLELPEAEPFADGKLTARHISCGAALRSRPVYWQTTQDIRSENRLYASEILENMGMTEYGVRFFLGYPELKEPRGYHTLLVFRAPGGFACSYYLGQIVYESGGAPSIKMYWPFLGNEFFEYLYEWTGSIPAGTYTIDCYFNGMAAASTSFELY